MEDSKGNDTSNVHVDYFNRTELPIEILDSPWFTTIVRNEGSAVGGPFRLQPCASESLERKPKWGEPYEKAGHVRKAEVLKKED